MCTILLYIGKAYEFVNTELNVRKKNIVVSRKRKIVEDEKNTSCETVLVFLFEDQVLDGISF
jgi:ribosomal protein S1